MSYPQTITKTIKEFTYVLPSNIEEAVSALAKYGAEARVIAGGTDLVPLMKHRQIVPKYVVSLRKVPGMDYIRVEGDRLRIGALTRIAAVRQSEAIKKHCFAAYEASLVFATTQVRNRATVGGNICRSSPSADMVPPLMCLGAQVKLLGPDGERVVPLETFFTGPGSNVLDREVLTEITLPLENRPYGTAFRKVSRNSADLAKVNCAVKVVATNGRCEDVRVALGGVAPKPVRAYAVEDALRGERLSDEVIDRASELVVRDIAPITDVRSTAEYRREVSKVLVRRMVKLAWERCRTGADDRCCW